MIDKALTAHLAEISKIAFTKTELDEMAEDMKSIAALMDMVRKFDGGGEYSNEAVGYDDLQKDEYEASIAAETITKNAAVTERDFFSSPKAVWGTENDK